MGKTILVVDIETTGYLNQGGKIVEIGIVKLDLDTGEINPVFNSCIKETGFNEKHMDGKFGWIFKNSSLTYNDVLYAPDLDSQRFFIQYLFNIYHATAYNKEFDFGFLKDRGFIINELPCPMLLAAPILNINNSLKWPKLEEAWVGFFGDTNYVEKHRAIDDALHEAKIVHKLYEMHQFSVPYNCVNAILSHYLREENGSPIFVYNISGTNDGLFALKKALGKRYKINNDGMPVYYSETALSNNRNEIIQLIIKSDGKLLVDQYLKEYNRKKNLDSYMSKELARQKNRKWDIEKIKNLIPIFNKGFWGFCDDNRLISISCKYEIAKPFSFGLALVKSKGKFGFINYFGEEVIPLIYDEAESFNEGLALVKHKEWIGFINRNGEKIIDVGDSNYTQSFSEGLAVISDYYGTNFGFIDSLGKIKIPLIYLVLSHFLVVLQKLKSIKKLYS
jgi:DNA polymerase-3 subunit epsilon